MNDFALITALGTIIGLVLILPLSVRWVEEELETFLLAMGAMAVTVSGLWSWHLVGEALREPVKITAAVLIAGLAFRICRDFIRRRISWFADKIGLKYFLFIMVAGLGLLSSAITAIIAAIVLVEIISGLTLAKDKERALVILACYSIGLGAALTPLGEPLSTIVTARLSGEPYHAGFFFLTGLLWVWIITGIVIMGLLAAGYVGPHVSANESLTEDKPETLPAIFLRAGKVYAFVSALVLLGHGFSPIVDRYLIKMSKSVLYWVNMVSAILDNATLAAAQISPRMELTQIQFILLGLLIAGGMLIPGNIPNIISAGKLKIGSRDWAKFAVPLGLTLMVLYFIFLQITVRTT